MWVQRPHARKGVVGRLAGDEDVFIAEYLDTGDTDSPHLEGKTRYWWRHRSTQQMEVPCI